ncbi:MAG TPA: cytochrome c maturation protein CcmE, partial [Bryobacterales bacterium]|nr:cytochrome c maturation protein CcmE [Bryobacterales bacterium]
MNPRIKFGLITVVIVGVLGWLAMAGINETATYYVTIQELRAMDEAAKERRLRVGGDVEVGSIVRKGERVEFTIIQADDTEQVNEKLQVVYVGRDPLPDTFRDRAQALCTGRMRDDNVFEANHIQAKCASKYEAEPGKDSTPV